MSSWTAACPEGAVPERFCSQHVSGCSLGPPSGSGSAPGQLGSWLVLVSLCWFWPPWVERVPFSQAWIKPFARPLLCCRIYQPVGEHCSPNHLHSAQLVEVMMKDLDRNVVGHKILQNTPIKRPVNPNRNSCGLLQLTGCGASRLKPLCVGLVPTSRVFVVGPPS